MISEKELRDEIRKRAFAESISIRQWAIQNGRDPSEVYKMYRGDRAITKSIAKLLGYKRIDGWVKLKR